MVTTIEECLAKQLNNRKNSKLCAILSCSIPINLLSDSLFLVLQYKNQQPHNLHSYENQKTSRHWRKIESIYSSPKIIHSQELSPFHMPEDSMDKSDSQGLYIFYLKQTSSVRKRAIFRLFVEKSVAIV